MPHLYKHANIFAIFVQFLLIRPTRLLGLAAGILVWFYFL